MREIKFRAWLKKEIRMVDPVTGLDLTAPYATVQWFDNVHDALKNKVSDCWLEDCELMQYTGLKDKKGKEIYEGDIVKNHTPAGENHSAYDEIGEVIWDKTRIIARIKRHGLYFPIIEGRSEVIGNIYENPELLEVKS